jgi:hypothetical protein
LLILVGVEVAGERVDCLQHAIHRAERNILDVGLLNVLALDAGKDFGIYREVTVSVIR